MDTYRYDHQGSSSFKGTRRVVTAQAGPYTSLQLPVIVCNEQYKSVIDVGLPTSLISTAIWQKVSSPLYPITENEIAERVTKRTNLQLMGYTHFQLQVGQTVLELEDALVYDYDEPEIFLSISAVAALGLVIDFQEGTFGLRSVDGLRCSWNEDTVLFPNDKLGNFNLSNKPKPSAGNYYDYTPSANEGHYTGSVNESHYTGSVNEGHYTGSVNESHHTNNMVPYHAPGNSMGKMSQDMSGHIPIGIDKMSMGIPGLGDLNYNERASMPPRPPVNMGPIQPPVNMAMLNPYSMAPGPMPVKKPKKQRKSVNLKKFKNFYLKVNSSNNSKGRPANFKLLNKISNWHKDPTKVKASIIESNTSTNKSVTNTGTANQSSSTIKSGSTVNSSSTVKDTTIPQKTVAVKQDGANSSTLSSPFGQNTLSKNQKRKAKRKLQAQLSPVPEKKIAAPITLTNSNNKDTKAQKKKQCVNCHSIDHTIERCTAPIALKCVYCEQTGHLRTNCPTVLKTSPAVSAAPDTSLAVSPIVPVPENLQSSADSSITKPEIESPVVTSTPLLTSTPVAVKRSASSPETGVIKKKVIAADLDAPAVQESVVSVQKPVEEVTHSGSGVNTENNLSKTSLDPIEDLDDSSKKPELDVVEREPVKRVVAKKNIKLNMLPKSNTSKEGSSDSNNAPSTVVKDTPMKSDTDTAADKEELVPDKAEETPLTQVPADDKDSTVVDGTIIPTETSN